MVVEIKVKIENRLNRRDILEDLLTAVEGLGEKKHIPQRNPFGLPLDFAARLQTTLKRLAYVSLQIVDEASKKNVFETIFAAMIFYPMASVFLASFLFIYALDQLLIFVRKQS